MLKLPRLYGCGWLATQVDKEHVQPRDGNPFVRDCSCLWRKFLSDEGVHLGLRVLGWFHPQPQ